MKILIFGATGTVGRHLVMQSLQQGHEITAFCRNKADLSNEKQLGLLNIIEGDVLNYEEVEKSVASIDAVIVTLGSGKNRKGNVRSEGTRNIIKAMKSKGIKRLICQTTLGLGESKGNLNFFWKRIHIRSFSCERSFCSSNNIGVFQAILDHQLLRCSTFSKAVSYSDHFKRAWMVYRYYMCNTFSESTKHIVFFSTHNASCLFNGIQNGLRVQRFNGVYVNDFRVEAFFF